MKTCIKCEGVKSTSSFPVRKGARDGTRNTCKKCTKEYSRSYRHKNINVASAYNKKYKKEHAEEAKLESKRYYKKNKARIKKYLKDNKEKIAANKKIYDSKYKMKKATSSHYLKEIPPSDEPKFTQGNITVLCVKCKTRMTPTNSQVTNRIKSFKSTQRGESNFYCSDNCKNTCLLFDFHVGQQIDSRSSRLKSKQHARNCQTGHLKQIQCDEVGYNYCEKCGDIINVDLHHTHLVGSEDSISSAGHILLCPGCHVELEASC